jgi:hypothetical protein
MKIFLILMILTSFEARANKWLDMGCSSTDIKSSIIQNLGKNQYVVRSVFGNRVSHYVAALKTIKVKKAGQIFPYWSLRRAGFIEVQMKNGFAKKFKLFKESVECAKLVAERNLDEYQYTLPKISDTEFNKIKKEHQEYDRKRDEEDKNNKKEKTSEIKKVIKRRKKENKNLNKLFE